MKTKLLSVLALGFVLLCACGDGKNKKDEKAVKETSTEAQSSTTNTAKDKLIGTWVLTDWDDQFDEGGYDPGDKWKFQANGDFAGYGLRGSGLSEGKWSVNDKMLTIVLDESTVTGEGGVEWTVNGTVQAEIAELTENSMHLSGKIYFECRSNTGETQSPTQRMDIRLKPESAR